MGNLKIVMAPAEVFGIVFNDARKAVDQVAQSTSEFAPIDGTRYYLASNGTAFVAGFAVRNGELVYLFSTERGNGDTLVRAAINRGAKRLDCFDGYLVGLYGRHGFVETHREPNWVSGNPDVVYMAHSRI